MTLINGTLFHISLCEEQNQYYEIIALPPYKGIVHRVLDINLDDTIFVSFLVNLIEKVSCDV